MDRLDHIRAGQHEVIVAPLERFSAEVIGREVVALDVRAHRAVEYQHAVVEGVEVARVAVGERARGARVGWGARGLCRSIGHVPEMKTARMRERRAGALADVLRGRKLP